MSRKFECHARGCVSTLFLQKIVVPVQYREYDYGLFKLPARSFVQCSYVAQVKTGSTCSET